jgi:hypothetical protein
MNQSVPTPNLALLGWCDRAARIEGVHPAFAHVNVQGLSQVRFSHFFPINLRGTTLALGLYNPRPGDKFSVEFVDSDNNKVFDFEFSLNSVMQFDSTLGTRELDANTVDNLGWTFHTAKIENNLLIAKPDAFKALLRLNGQEQFLGYLHLLHAPLLHYSADQIAALRTDPLARRLVRVAYSCIECASKLQTYAGLERNKQQEAEGWEWFADLPDEFRCKCGKMAFSLQYIRTGLHGLLSRNLASDDMAQASFLRLYETTKLEEDCRQFKALLEKDVSEQEIQHFLEAHPVFFSRFSAHRLVAKPKIQNKYEADFAILNHRRELVLIEIEKGNLRLLTKKNRITADLQHAVTQVTDWIQEVNDHRAAVLGSLRMELKEVAIVRGIVIAGRNPCGDEEARALRRAFSGDVEFFTYDDLLDDITEIVRRIANA